MNEASEETAYTLIAEGGDVYADLREAQAAALPAVARALADLVRARAGNAGMPACKERSEPYEV